MEPSLKTFSRQADRLYERGVAAARGGQRTVAAGLLRQAVKLNPQHENAWLWLSGVLEDPGDVAFCLRAVLDINPANERARRGLAMVTERLEEAKVPARLARLAASPIADPVAEEPWWRGWRDAQRVWRSTIRLLWLFPSLLLVVTLIVRWQIQATPLPAKAFTYLDLPTPTATAVITVVPSTPTAEVIDPSVVTNYFVQVRTIEERLKSATTTYRDATDKSRTTVERVAAVRTLRDSIAQERGNLLALVAPTPIQDAHTSYLDGLQLEQQALDELLNFYGSYDIAQANRAALGLQDARAKIDLGKQRWDSFARDFNSDPTH